MRNVEVHARKKPTRGKPAGHRGRPAVVASRVKLDIRELRPSDVLPIKAALAFELLKTRSPSPFLWNRTTTITFRKDGTGVPHNNAYLVRTDQRQATGVWYAVDRELLFGVGRCSGRYPSHPFSYIRRVCSSCYRKCGSYFLPRKLSYNTIRRTADFTESDSAERRCS